MTLSRSLSNSDSDSESMQVQVEDKISRFLEKKFRISHSFATKRIYHSSLKRFLEFIRVHYNMELLQLLRLVSETKQLDPLDVLDEYYTFLSKYQTKTNRTGYSNEATNQYVRLAKDFLNNEGCRIYNEDLKLKFRLPKRVRPYEKGLTKDVINRAIRFANRKLATVILMACSSGMRIGEIVQLRMSDVEFTKTPTTILIRAETAKTRETRITHISTEATKALKDYLAKSPKKGNEYVFLLQHDDRIKWAEQRQDKRVVIELKVQLKSLPPDERYAKSVSATIHNLDMQLARCVKDIPELDVKNQNGKNWIHFHAFRAWFKTQVTDAHQSDFAEALMGHKSLKLVYYRQNDKARSRTYLDIEHALTIADTEKIDENFSEMQKDNLELRGIVDSLSKQLRNLEKRIEV